MARAPLFSATPNGDAPNRTRHRTPAAKLTLYSFSVRPSVRPSVNFHIIPCVKIKIGDSKWRWLVPLFIYFVLFLIAEITKSNHQSYQVKIQFRMRTWIFIAKIIRQNDRKYMLWCCYVNKLSRFFSEFLFWKLVFWVHREKAQSKSFTNFKKPWNLLCKITRQNELFS